MPSDASGHAYEALAEALTQYEGSVDEALTDASLLKRVAKNAEQAVQKRYEQKNCHCRHKVAMTGSLMSLWSAFSS